MFKRKQKPRDFNEYFNSRSEEARVAMLKFMSKYGEPEDVLAQLMALQPICLTKKVDVRINERFLLWYDKETLLKKPNVYLFATDTLDYCYHVSEGIYGKVGFIREQGEYLDFYRYSDSDETIPIFLGLQQYIRGFDNLPQVPPSEEVLQLSERDDCGFYYLQGSQLLHKRFGLLKESDTLLVENIQDIIWCDQYFAPDSEAADVHGLELYIVGKKQPERLLLNTDAEAFQCALELKKRVPHLMYGPSQEYRQIFKKDPEQLLSIAKSKLR